MAYQSHWQHMAEPGGTKRLWQTSAGIGNFNYPDQRRNSETCFTCKHSRKCFRRWLSIAAAYSTRMHITSANRTAGFYGLFSRSYIFCLQNQQRAPQGGFGPAGGVKRLESEGGAPWRAGPPSLQPQPRWPPAAGHPASAPPLPPPLAGRLGRRRRPGPGGQLPPAGAATGTRSLPPPADRIVAVIRYCPPRHLNSTAAALCCRWSS